MCTEHLGNKVTVLMLQNVARFMLTAAVPENSELVSTALRGNWVTAWGEVLMTAKYLILNQFYRSSSAWLQVLKVCIQCIPLLALCTFQIPWEWSTKGFIWQSRFPISKSSPSMHISFLCYFFFSGSSLLRDHRWSQLRRHRIQQGRIWSAIWCAALSALGVWLSSLILCYFWCDGHCSWCVEDAKLNYSWAPHPTFCSFTLRSNGKQHFANVSLTHRLKTRSHKLL